MKMFQSISSLPLMFVMAINSYASVCRAEQFQEVDLARPVDTTSVSLAGKNYSRIITTGGMFGQPAQFKHTIRFLSATTVLDNANSAFGNPPETYSYTVSGLVVSINENGNDVETYTLSQDLQTLTGTAKAVLKIESLTLSTRAAAHPASAIETPLLHMIFARGEDGAKKVGCQWISRAKLAICHFGLRWTNRGDDEFGYMLDQAEKIVVAAPALDANCILKKFVGHISMDPHYVTNITMHLTGSSCEQFISAMPTTKISLFLSNVPSEIGGAIVPQVVLQVDETSR
ncbi:MAG: hypothetical protein NTV34_08565 [Proteobacteria bacterium]|nr:hypothetical protein [Pseudomonadota bacterium]